MGHGRLYTDPSCSAPLTNGMLTIANGSGQGYFDTRDGLGAYALGTYAVSASGAGSIGQTVLPLKGRLVFDRVPDGGMYFLIPAGSCTTLPALKLQGLVSSTVVLSDAMMSTPLALAPLTGASTCAVVPVLDFPANSSTYAPALSMNTPGDPMLPATVTIGPTGASSLMNSANLSVRACLIPNTTYISGPADCCSGVASGNLCQ